MEIRQNIVTPSRSDLLLIISNISLPSRPAFQDHARPLEVARIDRLPMTSCLWSIVIMDLSCTVS